ncbi:MAG: SDR family NAD(P)-dependent oxidoreductase, partial [Balneolaceae bacterium]
MIQTAMKTFYHNKIILITGAASGIGKRFAERITEISDPTLILWDRNPDELKKLKDSLPNPKKIHISGIDVSDSNYISLEAGHLIKQRMIPDIIINCAGIVVGKLFHDHTPAEIRRTMDINATGSMWVVHSFLNEMIERGS